MKKSILAVAMFVFLFGCAKSNNEPKWEILELTDQFNEKTGGKNVVYLTKGSFIGSESKEGDFSVVIRIYGPNRLGVDVSNTDLKSVNDVLYSTDLESLEDAGFSYRRDDLRIDSISIKGGWDGDLRDDKTSLWSLMKQEGILRISAYDGGEDYLFDVNCNGLNEILKLAFLEKPAIAEYSIIAADQKQREKEIEFTLRYLWTPEKESQLKNYAELDNTVKAFFSTKNYDDYLGGDDYLGSSYFNDAKDKVMSDWANPLLEEIRLLFNDPTLEYPKFNVRRYYRLRHQRLMEPILPFRFSR
jgi:hypothetical protein